MLRITVPRQELWDERFQTFLVLERDVSINLEHSLVSLSKWESKWHKPFLSKDEKTREETVDYVRCMTLSQNENPTVYSFLTDGNIKAVTDYIDDPMSAARFSDRGSKGGNGEMITAETIYYWMITCGIPFECQKWHLNRLLALIRFCNIKNGPQKKMSQRDVMSHNAYLNEMRKKQLRSKG